LGKLSAVLHVSVTTRLVTTLHASFLDYMMFTQSSSARFYCDMQGHNTFLTRRCFGTIKIPDPPFSICSLELSCLFDRHAPDLAERVEKSISTELFYACRYLGVNLVFSRDQDFSDELYDFPSVRLLF
jgi:hypothetical protein